MDTTAAPPIKPSFISPAIDFLMLGGLTFFVFPLVMLPVWKSTDAAALHVAAIWLIYVSNLPHFIHSYQLLYNKKIFQRLSGTGYSMASRIRIFIAGIVTPITLITLLAFGALQDSSAFLGYTVNSMLFLTGWHYAKQGYGIMIALSVRKKVFFDGIEKKILLANAYIAWIFSWISMNTASAGDIFQGIPYRNVGFSHDVLVIAQSVFFIWTVLFLLFLLKKFDRHKTLSLNGMMAYFVSVYAWVAFSFSHPYLLIFVPALHGMQYLLFVWKIVYERNSILIQEQNHARAPFREVTRKMVPFLVTGFSIGAIFFVWLPLQLDQHIPYDKNTFGSSLFVFMFLIFLNIHHYFIDFAIWRRENPEMKYLFR